MKKKIVLSSIVLSLLFVFFISTNSFAQSTGTILFKARDIVGNPVDDLEVKIYKVANFEVPEIFVEDEFKQFDVEDYSETNIKAMGEYAKSNSNPILTKTTDKAGDFTLDIERGIYLIIQSNRFDDCKMQTMYVSIPEITNSGRNYTVTVKPKIDVKYGEGGGDDDLAIKDLKLPQTGIIRVPIIILAVSGIALFSISWVIFYTKKKIK